MKFRNTSPPPTSPTASPLTSPSPRPFPSSGNRSPPTSPITAATEATVEPEPAESPFPLFHFHFLSREHHQPIRWAPTLELTTSPSASSGVFSNGILAQSTLCDLQFYGLVKPRPAQMPIPAS